MCKISEDLHINIHWNKQTYLKWLTLSAQYWWKFQDHTIPGSKVILTYSTSIYILLWHFKRCFYHYKENKCAKFQKNDVNGCRYLRAGHSDRWPKGHGCIKTLPYLFCTAICPDTKRLSKFRSIVLLVVELLKLKCPAQYHALNFKTWNVRKKYLHLFIVCGQRVTSEEFFVRFLWYIKVVRSENLPKINLRPSKKLHS